MFINVYLHTLYHFSVKVTDDWNLDKFYCMHQYMFKVCWTKYAKEKWFIYIECGPAIYISQLYETALFVTVLKKNSNKKKHFFLSLGPKNGLF